MNEWRNGQIITICKVQIKLSKKGVWERNLEICFNTQITGFSVNCFPFQNFVELKNTQDLVIRQYSNIWSSPFNMRVGELVMTHQDKKDL